jgi:hypothetical protein
MRQSNQPPICTDDTHPPDVVVQTWR